MSVRAGNPDRWRAIDDNAGLGLPLPAGGRRRFAKRLVARACRPFLARQIAFNRDLLAEIVEIRNSLVEQIAEVRASLPSVEIAGLARELASRGEAVDHLLPVVERHGYSIEGTEEILADLARDRELMREEVELASQQSLVRLHDVVGALRAEMGDVAAQIDELDGRVGTTARSVEDVAAELHASTSQLRVRLAQVDLLLGRVRRALPETPPLEDLAGLPGPFATMYGAFEEAFRGSHEVVSERVRPYLDDILAVASERPVLDIGCGRGELLEQLGAAGVPCYGIEIDSAYAASGRERGLDVRLVDARAHLEGLEAASLRAVSAIQVVEHLATDDVIGLLDHAMRAIEPGGLLVLETPNPDNLIVGASSFYLDPTHLHPIPPLLLAFLVEARGFVDVEVRPLARRELQPMAPPAPDQPWSEDLGRIVTVLNTWLFGAQDYAVLARRP